MDAAEIQVEPADRVLGNRNRGALLVDQLEGVPVAAHFRLIPIARKRRAEHQLAYPPRLQIAPSMRLLDSVLSISACSRSVFRRWGDWRV